uniref:Uncharacterized protein n=1 Tax=uncultured prokaryote TaxID=198431 RepID=A0A0H5Q5T9_9ZZZZ|nr:hypothetical protein [uncultured prokaryote]
MALLKAVVQFQGPTLLPEDIYQNTFYFAGTATTGTQAVTVNPQLVSFYNTVHTPGTTALCGFMAGDLVKTNGMTIKFYDMADPSPRSPINTTVQNLGALSGTAVNLPKEVAVAISYQSTRVSGVNQASRRGRIYHGPLNGNVMSGSSTTNDFIDTSYIAALKGAGSYLRSVGDSACNWSVYSKKLATPYQIVNGWVDNAFDSQRRRGQDPTTRNAWT